MNVCAREHFSFIYKGRNITGTGCKRVAEDVVEGVGNVGNVTDDVFSDPRPNR